MRMGKWYEVRPFRAKTLEKGFSLGDKTSGLSLVSMAGPPPYTDYPLTPSTSHTHTHQALWFSSLDSCSSDLSGL